MTETAAHSSQQPFEPPLTTLGKYCPSCHSVYLPPEAEANYCAKDGAQLLIEQRIFGGKYVLGEPLGFGHMSEVYVATQASIGRRVALKLLRSEHATSGEMRKRFEREAQIASSLDHPNAVTIFDSGHTSDGQSYIAMELLSGETLDRVIQREAPMSLPRALELLIPAVRALAAAHSHGIIHRDVKPENIFVARKPLSVGAEEVVKVLDFGIARVLGRKTRVTSTQTALGTPHYMAPETLQGEEATTQSDVYAVGVILTEMLTGKLPWGESSRSDVSAVMARMVSQPHRLSALLPGTRHPPDLQPALDQFLSQQLEDRPVDCAVALHILLQLSSPSVTSLPPAASSISLPPLSDSRPGPITLPAPDSSPLVETPSQERATRPMRSATAVMNSHRSQHTSDRSRWLVVVLAMVGSLVTLWLFKAKVRSLPKSPALAAAIAPAPQRRLFVPDGATTAEPPPAGEPTEPRKTEPLKPEPVPQVAKPSPDKSKRPSRGHREKPVDPPNLAFPLDTKGY